MSAWLVWLLFFWALGGGLLLSWPFTAWFLAERREQERWRRDLERRARALEGGGDVRRT